jgi:uncharacterized protein
MTDFIGCGWAFPPAPSLRGGIALVTGRSAIEAALRMILSTAPGERVMRPEFGCAAWDHVFDVVNSTTLGMVEQAVGDAVRRWEPRIELLAVTARAVDDGVVADLSYRVKATNDRRNLVHPFYEIAGRDAP